MQPVRNMPLHLYASRDQGGDNDKDDNGQDDDESSMVIEARPFDPP
eukprot:CAMPEP_0115221174 /NCGR_PEP_ID=MMETSP0270-20121206/27827_1 /TAXON_ID=71861 /ORGANISM="Scrippsiella trochoidea, Strain CCMP3099" /LENGTH=45 /DNA_ID= /DNA_START= /DNA_END= /DNA_ORIENTATION=